MERLMNAVEIGDDVTENLINACRDLDLEREDLHRKTPLSVAITCNRFDVVSLLLEKGASPNAPYDMFWTTPPILAAARSDSFEITELLLAYGARVDDMDKCGLTALVIAARRGNLPLCRLLLDRGAHLHHVTEFEPLPPSLSRYVVSIVSSEEFYQRRSEPFKCNDALNEACRYRHPEVVREFLNRMADARTSKTSNGNTALHIAAFCETQERYVPDTNEPARCEVMPTCPATVQILIQHGADLQAVNQFNETPAGRLMSHLATISNYRTQSNYVREQLSNYFINFCLLVKAGCPLAEKYFLDVANDLRFPKKRWVDTLKILTVAYSSQKAVEDEQSGDTELDVSYINAMKVAFLSGLPMTKGKMAALYNLKIPSSCKYGGVVDEFFFGFVLHGGCLPKLPQKLRQLCQQILRRSIRRPLLDNVMSEELNLPLYLKRCIFFEYDVQITLPNVDNEGGTNLPDYFE
ncbi:poly [ADP-ribose] polymerase tankyrase-2-like [Lineus longissimus]|uniref:poly [ADP-ribose] polymerase tankyrase-2-like n=1 Tax=Lineus longissimus TaxID=88925 RepID=UPI002B4C7A85